MALEDMEPGMEINATPPPRETGNRTFIIVAGILGAIMLLTLVCMALYALVYVPQRQKQQATQLAEINAQNTLIARAAEETAKVAFFTATPTATKFLPTYTPSPTPVIAQPTTASVVPTEDPRTATVAALLTQAAIAQLTVTPTAAGLPETGFAEEVGVPGLIGAALVLLVVIILSRRLRTASR
jgi:LPXTG-motif cell wall-anchored protein